MNFLSELKRRNVIRMAGLYLVGAWLITQVSATVLPLFSAPIWMPRGIVIALIIGFIPAMIFAWIFEFTPEGFKRDSEIPEAQSIAPQTAQKMNRLIAALLVLAVVYFGFDKFVLAPKREAALVSNTTQAITEKVAQQEKLANEKSIAVLAFADLSPNKDQEYFSDGMAEEILNSLVRVDGLKVAGRTSSFFFKGKNEDIRNIGKALGVAHVLEGSVRKQGENVRITAQLIRANDGFHVWSETYDGDLKDVFALQEKIAQAITGELQIILQNNQKIALVNTGTKNTEAYQLYLQGRFHWHKRQSEELDKARVYFEKAIEADPSYALAYSGLADTLNVIPNNGNFRARDYRPKAKQAALKALELDPNLAEAHTSLAKVLFDYEFDFAGAEKSFQRALELNPNYASAHQWYSELLSVSRRHDEAVSKAISSVQLDPFSIAGNNTAAIYLSRAGRFDEALLLNAKFNALVPDEERFHRIRARIYAEQGQYEMAVEHFLLAAIASDEYKPETNAKLKAAFDKGGWDGFQRMRASINLEELKAQQAHDPNGYVKAMRFANAYAFCEDKDKAIQYLNKAYNERDEMILDLVVDNNWDFVRDDPRFIALVKKVGIPQ